MGEKSCSHTMGCHWGKYAELLLGKTGMPAKTLRMALGLLTIQKQYGYSDRGLVEQIV